MTRKYDPPDSNGAGYTDCRPHGPEVVGSSAYFQKRKAYVAARRSGVRQPRVYPVLCSWCLKQGTRTVIEYTTVSDSHGICSPCLTRVLAEDALVNDDAKDSLPGHEVAVAAAFKRWRELCAQDYDAHWAYRPCRYCGGEGH